MATTVADLEIVVGADTKDAEQGLDNLSTKTKNFSDGDLKAASAGLVGFGVAGVLGFGKALFGAMDFEAALTDAFIAVGDFEGGIDGLQQVIMDLGEALPFSATEVANLMEELGKLGVSSESIEGVAYSVMSLAAGLGEDLVPTGQAVIKILNSLGLGMDQVDVVANQLFKVLAAGTLDLNSFMDGWEKIGSIVKTAGMSFVDGAGFLTLLTDAGVDAATTGRTLAKLFSELLNPSQQLKDMMSALGIQFTDLEGNLLPVKDIILNVMDAWTGLTQAEKIDLAKMIAGEDMFKYLMTLFDQGRAKFEDFMEKYEAAMDLKEVIARKMATAKALWDTFTETVENASIIIGQHLLPAFKSVIGFVTNLVDAFQTMPDGLQKAIILIAGLVFGFTALVGALGLASMSTGIFAAGFALLTGPIGLTVAAVIALVAGFVLLYKNVDWFRDAVDATAGAVKDLSKWLGNKLISGFQSLMSVLKPMGPLLVAGWDTLLPILRDVASFIGGVLIAAWHTLSDGVSTFIRWATQAVNTVVSLAQRFGVLDAIMAVIRSVIGSVVGAFTSLTSAVNNIVDAFRALLNGDFGGFFSSLKDAALDLVDTVVDLTATVPKAIYQAFKEIDWGAAASDVVRLVTAGIRGGAGALDNLWGWLTDSLQNAFSSMKSAVSTGIQLAWNAITSINWREFIPSVAWNAFITAVDLAKKVGAFAWDMFVVAVDLASKVGEFAWDVFVKAVDLAAKVGEFAWDVFVTGVDLTSKVGAFVWGVYVTSVNLAKKVGEFLWSAFVTKFDLAAKVGSFAWSSFVTGVNFIEDSIVSVLGWADFIPDIDWGTFIPDFSWPSITKDDILNAIVSLLPSNDWVGNESETGNGAPYQDGTALKNQIEGNSKNPFMSPGALSGGFGASNALAELNTTLATARTSITAFVSETMALLGGWLTGVQTMMASFTTSFHPPISQGTSAGKQSFITFVADTIAVLGVWSGGITNIVTSAMSTFRSQTSSGTSAGKQSFIAFVSDTIGVMGGWSGGVTNIVTSAMSTFKSQTSSGTSTGKQSFITFVADTIAVMGGWSGGMRSTVSSTMSGVVSTITSGMATASSAIRGGASSWPGIVSGYAGSMNGAGVAVGLAAGQGVYSGMMSALGMVRAAANAIIAEVDRAMRAKAQIHSPSKLTAYFGEMLGEGLVAGMNDMQRAVARSGQQLALAAVVQPPVPQMSYATMPVVRAQVPYSTSGGTVIHQTNHYTVNVDDLEDLNMAVEFVKDLPRERQLIVA